MEKKMQYDKVIIGAGIYGLYAAEHCARREEKILVLEYDSQPFCRATYINQARVHMGYHYPRSLSTAMKSAGYFERFVGDYGFCINQQFEQVYAMSREFSWTDAEEFRKFCDAAGIFCRQLHENAYFKEGMCDGTFLTKEYTYDAMILKKFFLDFLESFANVTLRFHARIQRIQKNDAVYEIYLSSGEAVSAPYVLNASYASSNQILRMVEGQEFRIKYELCEIILCEVNEQMHNLGITVMDGPFFSIMPFGKTGLHSLTSVTFTPHMTCYKGLPEFECQKNQHGKCSPIQLGNCNLCDAKPETAFGYMANLARKYLKDEFRFQYHSSLFSMKPILLSSEIDDSRPTVIRVHSKTPTFISVLSGKINTIYDLDEVL